ncbi:Ig-like domain-containing protein [Pantoea sp. DY-5]|uniref:Ig-like domain-containing protein n=1 Tax=Pantoea sp. DY-5 TaxID=2871488 RepID=UPI001C95A8E6|nr:Ig-like domain-containing protein [Pantoea sp. DY-5]MBY4838457.1 hypothetical protein [Pantoea sp. DY-5]
MSNPIGTTNEKWTKDRQSKFSGTEVAEKGSTMEIVLNGMVYTTLIDPLTGKWDWKPPFELEDGRYTLTFRMIDQAKNIGAPYMMILNVDNTAPGQPEILRVEDKAGDKTGWLTPGAQTDDKKPTFSGSAEAGSMVRLLDGNTEIGSAVADENGRWTIIPKDPLTDGDHNFTVTSADKLGNISVPSDNFKLSIAKDPADNQFLRGHENFDDYQSTGNLSEMEFDSGLKFTSKSNSLSIGTELDMGHLLEINTDPATMSFGSAVESVSFRYQAVPNGSVVFLDENGKTLDRYSLGKDDYEYFHDMNYKAPSGKTIASVKFIPEETPGIDYGVLFIDTISWKYPSSSVNKTMDIQDETHNDISIHEVSLDKILAEGDNSLFIDDGKTQFMVNGNNGDVVQLKDILPQGEEFTGWQQQTGTVTIAGTEYHVYNHGEAELLVQEGVKTELV